VITIIAYAWLENESCVLCEGPFTVGQALCEAPVGYAHYLCNVDSFQNPFPITHVVGSEEA
jgi:hypothetical protein